MLGEMKRINITHIISNLTGIVVENTPICTLCNMSGGGGGGGGGALGHHLVHLSSLSCVACWERAAICYVPFLCLGPPRLPC